MITLGFFFVIVFGGIQIGFGPYADEASCYAQLEMMEQAGEEMMTVCYQMPMPNPDWSVELERDSDG